MQPQMDMARRRSMPTVSVFVMLGTNDSRVIFIACNRSSKAQNG